MTRRGEQWRANLGRVVTAGVAAETELGRLVVPSGRPTQYGAPVEDDAL
jgi:hypothetical protein